MKVIPSIFREYDIRGIAGEKFDQKLVAEYEKLYGKFPGVTLDPKTAQAVGQAFGTIIKKQGGKKILVGLELRPFAEELKKAFISGVIKTGINVLDIGPSPTPLVYFLVSHLKLDGGVSITGSHNIWFYNGFKLVGKNSLPLYGQDLQKLREIIEKENWLSAKNSGKVDFLKNAFVIYQEYAQKYLKLARPVKIVIDCGNGTPGLFAKDFLESLGAKVVAGLYLEPDANFPNHIPDPEQPKNVADLAVKVREIKAELGLAFDADGDRVGVVDEKGNLVWADYLLLLLAKDVLTRHPGKKILFDVKCSGLLETLIPSFGGIPLMHRTGHAPIKATFQKDKEVILGGEVSGHFYFAENHYRVDDGFWAAGKILQIYSQTKKPFSTLFSFIPSLVRTPEIKLPCADEVKFVVVEKIKKQLAKKYKVITIDGVRVVFDSQTWGLVRPSNTSPYLTLRFEGPTKEAVLKAKNIFADILEKYPEVGDKLSRTEIASPTGKLGYV
ncbi:MAG: phosphomannomutase/phosphoglucomutase [Microgenomates group bacterium]